MADEQQAQVEEKVEEKAQDATQNPPDWYHQKGWKDAVIDVPAPDGVGAEQVHITRYPQSVADKVSAITSELPQDIFEKRLEFLELRTLQTEGAGKLSEADEKRLAVLQAQVVPLLGLLNRIPIAQMRGAVTKWPDSWKIESLIELDGGDPEKLPKRYQVGQPLPVPRLEPASVAAQIIGQIPQEDFARIMEGININQASVSQRYGEKNS